MSFSILIAGAGIGGLTTALALHQRGMDAIVLERAETLRPLGVGINLLPHAVRELDHLGLADRLADIAVAPTNITYFDRTGALLFREPRGIAAGDSHPQLSVHRDDLQTLLLDAVTDQLGPDAVRTGHALTGVTPYPDGVRVHTARGDLSGDVLIGADGIGSAVRAALHPSASPLMWSGIQMFRGAAEREPFLDGRTMAIVNGGDGLSLVTYPIAANRVNWVLQVPAGPAGPLPGDAGWNRPAVAGAVARHVADWQLDWLDVAALIGETADVFEYPMVDRDPLPHWSTGRVTLLGDAAHPMYPVGANGASQAILDARALADEVATDVDAGLRRYEEVRRPATAAVVAANRTMHGADAHRPDDIARVTARYRIDTTGSSS